jgi:3-oxoacyl-[acyl-carrier-protein] synthase-3
VTVMRSVVLGCGAYLPSRIITNAELAQNVDTSDEWIVQRTGIRERRVAAQGEYTSDLAIHAAQAALKNAGVDARSSAPRLSRACSTGKTAPLASCSAMAPAPW